MIHYTDSLDNITADMLQGFFVDWPDPPSPATHLRLLMGSDHVVLGFDSSSGHVVGFITAMTDGVLAAYIPFLEVLPNYQNQGIGHQLIQRMLDRLRHLYMIDLLCDPELQPWYAKAGMHRATGMLIRNYDRQSGSE